MNKIKPILIGIIALFILVFLISLLMPSNIYSSNSIFVHGNKNGLMKYFNNEDSVKKWFPESRNSTFSINQIGDSSVVYNVDHKNQNDVVHTIVLSETADGKSIDIRWLMQTKLKWYPWEKFSGMFSGQFAAAAMDASLKKLKEMIDNNP